MPRPAAPNHNGLTAAARFTLLELIVAGLMVVFILSAALVSYRAASQAVEIGRVRLTAQQDARATLRRLVMDLRGAYRPRPVLPPPETGREVLTAAVRQEAFEERRQPHFTGGVRAQGTESINMITTAGIPVPGHPTVGLCRVAYRFDPYSGLLERGQAMYLGPGAARQAEMTWVAVSYSVHGLTFEFLDRDGRWVNGWNSADEDDALPAAVRITLLLDGGDGRPPSTYSTIARVAHDYDDEAKN